MFMITAEMPCRTAVTEFFLLVCKFRSPQLQTVAQEKATVVIFFCKASTFIVDLCERWSYAYSFPFPFKFYICSSSIAKSLLQYLILICAWSVPVSHLLPGLFPSGQPRQIFSWGVPSIRTLWLQSVCCIPNSHRISSFIDFWRARIVLSFSASCFSSSLMRILSASISLPFPVFSVKDIIPQNSIKIQWYQRLELCFR